MGMSPLFTIFVILVASAFLIMCDQAKSLDITTITEGTVKEAKTGYIKILDDRDGKEIRIAIDSNTVYDNVQKQTDLKAGDMVQVEYQVSHDKNQAISITKIEMENEDNMEV